jgi:hypothetical protein
VAFGVGLLVLVSPLRMVWASPGSNPWGAFGLAMGLVGLAVWVSRSAE